MEHVSLEVLSAPVRSYLELNLGSPDHYLYLRAVEQMIELVFERMRWGRKLTNNYNGAVRMVRGETFATGQADSEAFSIMRKRKPAEAPRLDLRGMELEGHIEHIEDFLGIEGKELNDAIRYMKQRMFL